MDEPPPTLDPPERGEGVAHPLAAWRERRGLSQKRFGEMARTASSSISRIENNKMGPKPELVSRIAQATGGEIVLPRRAIRRLPLRGGP
jgi:transcriptional regulator with XRE-family HTH domain